MPYLEPFHFQLIDIQPIMNAANNLSSSAHAINSFPVSKNTQLTNDKPSINCPKIEARKGEVQRTALLSSSPEKNLAEIVEKGVEKGNPAINSSSVRSTLPNYVETVGYIEFKNQHQFARILNSGSSLETEALVAMDGCGDPGKSRLEAFKSLLGKWKEDNLNRPLSLNKRESYLGMAAKLNQPEIVQFLIEKNASVDYRDNDGNTALDFARKYNSFEAMKVLAKHGAELTDADIRKINENDSLSIESNLLVEIFEKNKIDQLLVSVYDGDLEAIQQLLDEGVNPRGIGEKGMSPMDMALERNDKKVLDLMRSRKS